VFKNGMKAVLALKTKGRRSSISQYRAKQQVGLSFFTVSINGQGSIGLVLAMSEAGYPVVRADPDLSVHNGVCSTVQQGDVVHQINGEFAEGTSFGATVEKLRRTRPLTIEFVRPSTPEIRSRFYGQTSELMKMSVSKMKGLNKNDDDWSGGRNNVSKSRKKKVKLKKKVRR
jgi:C-terminal processing protease CtpA/Prc|tara:strand:- start:29 stop:544 length:516 start_codon:yes stop_codon:yes gene_type:complete